MGSERCMDVDARVFTGRRPARSSGRIRVRVSLCGAAKTKRRSGAGPLAGAASLSFSANALVTRPVSSVMAIVTAASPRVRGPLLGDLDRR